MSFFNKDENKMVEDKTLEKVIAFFATVEEKRKITKPRTNSERELYKRGIEKVFYNETKKTVVIKWRDGDITKAVCAEDDDFDLTVGFAIAYCNKRFRSKTNLRKIIKDCAKKVDKEVKKKSTEEKK